MSRDLPSAATGSSPSVAPGNSPLVTKPKGFAVIGLCYAALDRLPQLGARASTLKAVYLPTKKEARRYSRYAPCELKRKMKVNFYFDDDDRPNHNRNLQALLTRSDIDSVIIFMPPDIQPSIILRAFECGKHVLSQMPIASDVTTGQQLVKKYEALYKYERKLIWKVANLNEAERSVVVMSNAIANLDMIGKVTGFNANILLRMNPKCEDLSVPDFNDFTLKVAVNYIAVLRSLLPSMMVRVSGYMNQLVTVDTVDGTRGTFKLAIVSPGSPLTTQICIEITGERGSLEMTETGEHFITKYATSDKDGRFEKDTTYWPKHGWMEVLSNFFKHGMEGSPYDVGLGDPASALKDVVFFMASYSEDTIKNYLKPFK